MVYLITFLEGILSFVSPCMLPLLPVYLSYIAGGADRPETSRLRIPAFVLGFTISFVLLGLVFSVVGQLLSRYQKIVNLVCGGIMILFGLSVLGVWSLPQRSGRKRLPIRSALSALLFGLIYPIQLSPCVGAFLGSALALAASSSHAAAGAQLLLVYSLGLGLPFVLSGLAAERLDVLFSAIKRHYDVVKMISGGLLILVGVLIAAGLLSRMMTLFA